MINAIEDGAPWPEATLHGKAAPLAKDPDDLYDCMNYRVLAILPLVYRRWASIRFASVFPWIQEWNLPDMFAATDNEGAQDA